MTGTHSHVIDDIVGLAVFVYVFYLLCLCLKTFNLVSPKPTEGLGLKQ